MSPGRPEPGHTDRAQPGRHHQPYYLAQAAPDTFGTHYRGNVGRLITIGSPHRGVNTLELAKLAPRNSVAWGFIRLLEKLGLAPALPAKQSTCGKPRWTRASAKRARSWRRGRCPKAASC